MKVKKEQRPPSQPEWVKNALQTPLEVSLNGKIYKHHVLCNGDRRFPIGTLGKCCSCLSRIVRNES